MIKPIYSTSQTTNIQSNRHNLHEYYKNQSTISKEYMTKMGTFRVSRAL